MGHTECDSAGCATTPAALPVPRRRPVLVTCALSVILCAALVAGCGVSDDAPPDAKAGDAAGAVEISTAPSDAAEVPGQANDGAPSATPGELVGATDTNGATDDATVDEPSDAALDITPDAMPDAIPDATVPDMADAPALPDAGLPLPGAAQACSAAAECAGLAAKVCDPTLHVCVACLQHADCGPGALCLAKQCAPAKPCKGDGECKATDQVCDKGAAACVDCVAAADCAAGAACVGGACVASKPCKSSKECAVVCDVGKGVCADCANADDCPAAAFCAANGKCQPDVCGAGQCAGANQFFACKPDGGGFEAPKTCDDGNACTNDVCSNGTCASTAASLCNDGNPCTDDTCDTAKGCGATPNSSACSDGDACTEGDQCQAGQCVGKAKACDDANPCTTDTCGAGKCGNVVKTGACSDNDPCTEGESCATGKCAGGTAKNCIDGNGCTLDACNATKGCTYTPQQATACSDGDGCTVNDQCFEGVCAGKAKACDDGNPCTDDSCAAGACKLVNNSAPCKEGSACGACKDGKCNAAAGGFDVVFGGSKSDSFYAIAPAPAGGWVLAGHTNSKGTGNEDGWLVKVDAGGEKQWDKAFGTTLVDVVRAIVPVNDGHVTAGFSQGGPTQTMDGWMASVGATGEVLWSKYFGGSGNQRLYGACKSSQVVVAVGYVDAPAGANGWLLRVDASGAEVISEVYGGANNALQSVACVADDKAVAAGYTLKAGSQDGTLMKLKASGTVEWSQIYGDGANQNLSALAVLADGGLAAAGVANSLGDTSKYRPWVVRTDAAGNLLWQKVIDVAVVHDVAGVVGLGGGGFAIAGRIQPAGQTHVDGWAARLDSAGDVVWQQKLGGNLNDMFFAVATLADQIVLAGYNQSKGSGADDGWLVQMGAAGAASCECTQDAQCTDANPCTTDICSYQGKCAHGIEPVGKTCGAFGFACNGGGTCAPTTCGNGKCEGAEDAINCKADCVKVSGCGDGFCAATETWYGCPQDCAKPYKCGNGWCEAGESTYSCPQDCAAGSCWYKCGTKSAGACWCDAACKYYNDCCWDFWYYCPYVGK